VMTALLTMRRMKIGLTGVAVRADQVMVALTTRRTREPKEAGEDHTTTTTMMIERQAAVELPFRLLLLLTLSLLH
jgi:hypothetical protein